MSPSPVVLVAYCLLVGASLALAAPRPPHTHAHAHNLTLDDINQRLDVILNNTRSRENYIRCFMDRGICNKDALSIKRILSVALSTNCSNCTHSQRLGAERFFEYLRNQQPETWASLTAKYDPRGKDEDDDDDEDDDKDDKDDDDDKKSHKHKHHHGNSPSPSGGSTVPPTPGGASGTVPANSTITMIF